MTGIPDLNDYASSLDVPPADDAWSSVVGEWSSRRSVAGRKAALAGSAVAVVVLAASLAALASVGLGGSSNTPQSAGAPPGSPDAETVLAPLRDGGIQPITVTTPAGESIPIRFTDGSKITVTDANQVLSELSLVPGSSGRCNNDACTPSIITATTESPDTYYGGPLTPAPTGQEAVLGMGPGITGPEIVFQFGRWYAAVNALAMDDAEIALWADHFEGEETEDGFLVLTSTQPLTLAAWNESAESPEVRFFGSGGRIVSFFLGSCSPTEDDVLDPAAAAGDGFASTCRGGGDVMIHAMGAPDFVQDVLQSVDASGVEGDDSGG